MDDAISTELSSCGKIGTTTAWVFRKLLAWTGYCTGFFFAVVFLRIVNLWSYGLTSPSDWFDLKIFGFVVVGALLARTATLIWRFPRVWLLPTGKPGFFASFVGGAGFVPMATALSWSSAAMFGDTEKLWINAILGVLMLFILLSLVEVEVALARRFRL